MPLYEYECTQCKRHTEKIQKFSDAEITQCPNCGGLLERVITAPAISFKGGGWYADGYGNAKPAAPVSEGKSDSGGSSESSTAATAVPAKENSASSASVGSASTGSDSSATSTPAASPAPTSEKS